MKGLPPLRELAADRPPPRIPDHELLRRIGRGSYGEVWLARTALGAHRAVKIVYRGDFEEARPYEREYSGIRRFEPVSRSHEGLVDVLQVGRNDEEGYFYYVMELADPVNAPGPSSCEGVVQVPVWDPDAYEPRTPPFPKPGSVRRAVWRSRSRRELRRSRSCRPWPMEHP